MTRLHHFALLPALLLAISPLSQAAGFQLSSPEIAADSSMPARFEFNGFGCTGENRSPALQWRDAPAGTQSYAITVYDPDAPTGSGWWHWSVINLPAETQALPAGAGAIGDARLPQGARQVRIDYGFAGWGGTCPPQGDKPHRYIFTIHALKLARLEVPADATAALAGYMIRANSLGSASFSAHYGRPAGR
ncbi:YbhB/YbcL family Raf kinase inhibitor-like protein [Paucibacter sp. APW11]|uniref:YbhB/YbcL family Raf kinase inhibitor-like protein n=1 Tax=Roseateles aquae TaxID=3077235 RepID=A0ABU3PGP7_9BURK|nr:YbhB/YbcL family Raf kinase inhibitor-like protein [Paucibacter sp. APW11]MDT9001634.1 YbhB/YbcL family Raf kinase inhibitor-like protein [Paucibacter sp. APW11]